MDLIMMQKEIPSHLKNLLLKGLSRYDRGLLFFILSLLVNPSKVYLNDISPIISETHVVLNTLNIDGKCIEQKATEEMEQTVSSIKKLPFDNLHKMADAGMKNYSKTGIFGEPQYSFDELDLPPVILGDETLFYPFKKNIDSLHDFDIIRHFCDLTRFVDWTNNFHSACIA
jgi:hypothetical protein